MLLYILVNCGRITLFVVVLVFFGHFDTENAPQFYTMIKILGLFKDHFLFPFCYLFPISCLFLFFFFFLSFFLDFSFFFYYFHSILFILFLFYYFLFPFYFLPTFVKNSGSLLFTSATPL